MKPVSRTTPVSSSSTARSTNVDGSDSAPKTSDAKKSPAPRTKSAFDAAPAHSALGFAKAATPALNQVMVAVANELETPGRGVRTVAAAAAREFVKTPQALKAFQDVLPHVERAAVAVSKRRGFAAVGKVAQAALPQIAKGSTAKGLIKGARAIGGVTGGRLMGAAIRGLSKGQGMARAAAEVATTAAKISAKSSGVAGKALAATAPVWGNIANAASIKSSVVDLIHAARDPDTTKGQVGARVLHLVSTVAGCFIPELKGPAALMDINEIVAPSKRAPTAAAPAAVEAPPTEREIDPNSALFSPGSKSASQS